MRSAFDRQLIAVLLAEGQHHRLSVLHLLEGLCDLGHAPIVRVDVRVHTHLKDVAFRIERDGVVVAEHLQIPEGGGSAVVALEIR